MKKSPIYPKYETTAYEGDGFDSHVVDFSQFLQEARHHAREVGFHSSSLHPEENVKKRLAEEKKVKKSWKNSLLSWWKTDKKSKLQVEPEVSSYNSTPRQRLVSGPIHGSGKNNDCRYRHPTSGPITGLFNPTKRVENEISYMCLDQLDKPHDVQTYGPVYLVT
nr:uncharacterized protein LOC112014124 isoform X2 [Quercus suber]XP_023902267.1 uncharacterized protein LOC112014124 isoform X2 [Quercus suber]XP_023902268.1 uncharacterized protein LOC112014124 isoform X2 [Quercus suber]XP_023902269.1 uncharacterized protein LOC112014124 isoform X2 [Quercus suber]XP_023902271.1 uncharacterized protein LOC112014124 isoform X2 [Quercus suber]